MNIVGSFKQVERTHLKPAIRRLRRKLAPYLDAHDLVKLAKVFGTDKWNVHWYAQHYARHFAPLRLRHLNILEIGVGGYEDPKQGGNSLRMWKAYFPYSMIYGIDIYDKQALEEPRVKILKGSGADPVFLKRVVAEMGGVDIVVDDGSHVNAHVITAFKTLFPLLNDQGISVVEDTQTSYWPGFGGSSTELNRPDTIMGYFKALLDSLNYEERIQPGCTPTYYDRHIVAMHFYHNLVFIMKGQNNEGSNLIHNNTAEGE